MYKLLGSRMRLVKHVLFVNGEDDTERDSFHVVSVSSVIITLL